MSDTTPGVDVSAIGQGIFDWDLWAGHIDFAMAKCTEGDSFIDPEFARNWEAMGDLKQQNGEPIFRFAYVYNHPSVDPARQAAHLVGTALSLGFIPGRDHFVIDHEDNDGMPPGQVSFQTWVLSREIWRRVPDSRIVIYTYPAFADAGNCAMLGHHALWIADYGVPVPEVPVPWAGQQSWAIWQHSVSKRGNKDVFHGDEKALQEFCSTVGPWTG